MDKIPGFTFLHKTRPEGDSRTKLTCGNCGAVVVIEECLWVNEYTNEQHIWCPNCTTQIGMWQQRKSSWNPPTKLPDST